MGVLQTEVWGKHKDTILRTYSKKNFIFYIVTIKKGLLIFRFSKFVILVIQFLYTWNFGVLFNDIKIKKL